MCSLLAFKAHWTAENHKIFVDVCLEQTLRGNKPGTHFNKEGWKNIVESFRRKSGFNYDKKQIKNHWAVTKKEWKVWLKLISDETMKWDCDSHTFGATEEDWMNYIEENPEAAQFRYKELECADKFAIIFDTAVNAVTGPQAQCKWQNDSSTSSTYYSKDESRVILNGEDDELCDADVSKSTVVVQAAHLRMIPSEQSMSSSSILKGKVNWNPSIHKVFLDLCVNETIKGNKPGTHFTKEGWRNIVASFEHKTGLRFDRTRLKNHWEVTKQQWRIWCNLVASCSMKWDPRSNKFGASEEDWAIYLQKHPEAAHFRSKELQFSEELEIIFNEKTDIGETEPPMKRKKYNDISITSTFPLGLEKPDDKTECVLGAFRSRANEITPTDISVVSSSQTRLAYSIGECIECLDGMEEVEQGSDLYLFALDMFLKKEYREIFLQLKQPSVRIAWLKRLQSAELPYR